MGRPGEPDGGYGDSTVAKFPTLVRAQDKFNDLGAAFRNAVAPLQGHQQKAVSGSGEFSPQFEGGAAKFLLSWREAFTICEETAGLIAGNIGKTAVDLKAVDVDASTAITL